MTTRKGRGMRTQLLVALALKADGFPHAQSAGSGRKGRDVLNTVGLAIEVKARRGLNLVGWLRQAVANAEGDVPALVTRPDGMGETTVDDWPVTMRFADWRALVRAAGYGTPLEDDAEAERSGHEPWCNLPDHAPGFEHCARRVSPDSSLGRLARALAGPVEGDVMTEAPDTAA